MTIMAAAVLFLPTIAHAESDALKHARDDVRANSNAAPLPVVKLNAPGEARNGVTGWTFAVLTMQHRFGGGNTSSARQQSSAPPLTIQTVKREPYGVFTSRDDCDIARAKKIAFLDNGNSRQPHWLKDAPTITTTVTVGSLSTTTERPAGPIETMNVTECAAEKFSTDSQTAQTAQKN